MAKKNSIKSIIFTKLITMEVGESINKSQFIIQIYGDDDYFKCRSFDAILCNVKKDIRVIKPERIYQTHIDNSLTRIK